MRWFRSLDPKATFRLFCFSHAGGGLADYRRWANKLPEGVTVDPVVLPGREQRMAETAFDRIEPLIDDLMPELFDLADETQSFAVSGCVWLKSRRVVSRAAQQQRLSSDRSRSHQRARELQSSRSPRHLECAVRLSSTHRISSSFAL